MAHGDKTRLYRGQGKLFLSKRVNGKPAGLEFVGNCPELMLNPQTEKIEHTESQTGNNSVDKVIERALKVELTMTLDSMASENLARMVFGKFTTDSAATITAEAHKAYAGKNIIVDQINVTAITSVTDAGGATTYTEGTDYEIVDLAAGMICLLDTGTIADGSDIEVNYSAGDSEVVAGFGETNTEYWLRFNGLNTAENNNPVVIDLFKVRFAPADDIPIINDDDFAQYKQSGDCLFDACQPADGKLGRYFAIRQLTPADAGVEC